MQEALDLLGEEGIHLDTLRVRGFPFGEEVYGFIDSHEFVFVVDQNRDGQMRTLLVNEGDLDPADLSSVLLLRRAVDFRGHHSGPGIRVLHAAEAARAHRGEVMTFVAKPRVHHPNCRSTRSV